MGSFSHAPPPQYAGLHEAAELGKTHTLIPFRCLGNKTDIVISGPPTMSDFESFVPTPIDTANITLPDSISSVGGGMRDILAENIHEVWAKNKIEAGFSYNEVSK